MKHTPGPWKVYRSNWDHTISVCGDDTVCLFYYLQEEDHNTVNLENCEANARLIAAAPDMLEALKECRRMYGGIEWSIHYPDEARLIRKIDEVIEKAEGSK